jgi:uncharacterized protein (DUF924 family)
MDDAATRQTILDFWFGPLDAQGMPEPVKRQLWFRKSAATDAAIRERFGRAVERALAGELDHWARDDDGLVALVVLLDQFPRNLFRGSPRAFAGDARALELSLDAIGSGRWDSLPLIYRVFLLLPLEHSEDRSHQGRCVELFTRLAQESSLPQLEDYVDYARRHAAVIGRFGRFPHRNAALGRATTDAEAEHLRRHGGF